MRSIRPLIDPRVFSAVTKLLKTSSRRRQVRYRVISWRFLLNSFNSSEHNALGLGKGKKWKQQRNLTELRWRGNCWTSFLPQVAILGLVGGKNKKPHNIVVTSFIKILLLNRPIMIFPSTTSWPLEGSRASQPSAHYEGLFLPETLIDQMSLNHFCCHHNIRLVYASPCTAYFPFVTPKRGTGIKHKLLQALD